MSEIVFILGAGASKLAGAPLIKDFLNVADELYNDSKVNLGDYKPDFEKVFSAISCLQSVHSKSRLDISNIESIFAAFEMGLLVNKFPGIVSDIEAIIISLKRLILKTLENTIKFEYQGGHIRPDKPYNSLSGLIKKINDEKGKNICSIITFNYDLALDYALHFNCIHYDYYLSENTKPDYVPVLKLHGSLNWTKCNKCNSIIPWHISNYFSRFHHIFLEDGMKVTIDLPTKLIEGNFEHCGEKINNTTPFLVPPTWNKTSYHNDLSNVWKQAAYELSDARNIFVSGYSLTPSDEFFRYLFALGTESKTIIKRFWVYDPAETDIIEKRFRNLIGQSVENYFDFQKKTFFDLLSEISNIKF
jgi:hypothetical protein